MAEGKQYQVSLTIDANVDRAKKAMKQLQSDLDKLSTSALTLTPASNIDKDLIKASQAAAQLKINLESAFNTKTGNLDLVKFNQSMKSAGMSAQKYQEALSSLGPAGDQAFSQLAMAVAKADAPFARVNSKLNEFATSLKNTAKWQISSSILHGLTGSINQAFSYAQQLNSSLNDIRIVTGASADEMAKFATQANQAAKSLSTSTRSYADAALIFYQQGLGDAEVKERTDAVIKMANVTKDSATEVSSYMTAIWNNFDDGSKSLEHYADVMTALGAATASSTAEIADGLEKFASIGKTIGLSYDYATSALATIVSQTRQSADTVGTGLRTIFSRLQGLSLGETLEDGVDLNKYSKALSTVGVSILDATGNMKDMDSILDSLASKWENLTSAQKTALAQTVGGVRQYTTLISLMDNWDSMETNLTTARSSSGALQEQADIYAESWDAAKNRVKASAEAIYSSLINDDFFIDLNNGFAGFLDQINNLIDGLGGLKGVLMSLTPIVTKLFRNQIYSGINSTIATLKNFTPSGQRENERVRTSFINQAVAMHQNDASIGGSAMADQSARVAQMQYTYMHGSNRMTEEQRNQAQYLMQQYEGVTARVQKAGDAANAATSKSREMQMSTQANVAEKGREYARHAQEASDTKKNEAISAADAQRQAQLNQIEQKRQQEVQRLQEERRHQVKTRRGPIDNQIRIENEKAAAARERAEREYQKQVKTAEQTHTVDTADIQKKQKRAEEARQKYTQQVRTEAFAGKVTDAVMAVKIDDTNIDASKEKLQALAAMIKKVAAEQDIDLGSPDEDGSYAQALQKIEEAANNAEASVESLKEAQNGLETASKSGQFGPEVTKSAEDEYSEAMDDLGATADEKHMGEIKAAASEEGTAIANIAQESAAAEAAAAGLNKQFDEMSKVKLDFSSGLMASVSAITAVGAAISSVQGLMNLWSDDSASLGDKLLGTLTTVATVAGSLGSAFDKTNVSILRSMATTIAAKFGWFGLSSSMLSTAGAAPVAGAATAAAGSTAAAGGTAAQLGWWPFTLIMLAVVAAVALVVAAFTGLMAVAQGIADAYNADAIAAEKAAATARSLASAYGEAQEKYNSMIETMDNYSSARDALDSLTEGTEAYNEALAKANEAGLELINSTSGLKRGEDYRWENGELIIDDDAMARIKQEEAQKVAQTRAASLMADAEAAKAKAKADQTALVRKDNVSALGAGVTGAAAGAALGSIIPVIGTAAGAIIGGLIGSVGAMVVNDFNDLEDDARIDKLTEQYRLMGEEAFDATKLQELGFDTANKAYIESVKSVVKATISAEEQMSNAARLAAEGILATDKTYQRRDQEDKNRIGAASGRLYQAYEQEAKAKYLEDAQSRGWFNTGTDEAKEVWEQYANLKGIDELNGYKVTNYKGSGDNASVVYKYIDDEGKSQEREVTAEQIAAELAAAEAAEKLGASTKTLIAEFDRLEASASKSDKALSDFLAGDMKEASKNEIEALSQESFKGKKTITQSEVGWYLDKQYGDGKDGKISNDTAKKYGYGTADEMVKAFQEQYNAAMKAWGSIDLPDGLEDWSDNLSLSAAQSLENTISNLKLGPMGETAGQEYVDGLNKMLSAKGISEDEQSAVLDQLMTIDWSDWDALSQADVILQSFGADLDLTSDYWIEFAENMRIAGRAVPDFSKLKSNLNGVSKILKDLKLGDSVSEDDYKILTSYNQEWSKFFVTQADGSRQFIGNTKDMAQATRELALEHKTLLETYSKAAQNDNISKFQWESYDFDVTKEFAQAKLDFSKLRRENGDVLNPVLEALGYDEEAITAALADPKKMETMFNAIYEAIDPTYLSQIDSEFKEMYASTATTFSELQGMLKDNTIDDATYSKSLISMASSYEYCTSAIEAYQAALASKDKDAIDKAKKDLEDIIQVEEKAAKVENTLKNAMSNRSSMSLEDLKTLSENNKDLYNQFLTASDDEWYEASYRAYSSWLDQRIAGYSKDSAEYKSLMAQKQAIDEEYYSTQSEKQQQALDAIIEEYENQINNINNIITILSKLSSGDKLFQDLSFTELNELETKLKEIGYTTQEVDALLKNLGKDEKKTEKESILAAMRAEVDMLLSGIAATDVQKQTRYKGLTTTLTIDDVQLGDNVPKGVEGEIVVDASATATVNAQADDETTEYSSGSGGAGGPRLVVKDLKNPNDATVTVGAEGDTKTLDKKMTKIEGLSGKILPSNANVSFGMTLTKTDSQGNSISAGTLWMGTDGQMHYEGSPNVGDVTFGAKLAGSEGDNGHFILEGNTLSLKTTILLANGQSMDISCNIGQGQIQYNEEKGLYLNVTDTNGTSMDIILSAGQGSILTQDNGKWILNAPNQDGVPVKVVLDDESLPDFLKQLQEMTEDQKVELGITEEDGLSFTEILLLYNWQPSSKTEDPLANLPTDKDDPKTLYYVAEVEGFPTPQPSTYIPPVTTTPAPPDNSYVTNSGGNYVPSVPVTTPPPPNSQSGGGGIASAQIGSSVGPNNMSWYNVIGQKLTGYYPDFQRMPPDPQNQLKLNSAKIIGEIFSASPEADIDWDSKWSQWATKAKMTVQDLQIQVASDLYQVLQTCEDTQSDLFIAGRYLFMGLTEGWNAETVTAFETKTRLVLSTIQTGLEERSPSRATMRMGKYLMEGLNIGWDKAKFEAGDIKGKILNTIADELKDINELDIGKLPLNYDFDNNPNTNDTVSQLQATWMGNDLHKNSDALQEYDSRRSQLRYMEGYILSKQNNGNGIAQDIIPTQFNTDGTFAIGANGPTEQQKTIFKQAFGDAYTSNVDTESGKVTIKMEGMDDLVFDNWSKAYEHAITTAFSDLKIEDWLIGDTTSTREGLDNIQNKIVSNAIEAYLKKPKPNGAIYSTIGDAIDALGIDVVLEGVQEEINKGYGELNNYSEESWAKIKDAWIKGAQEVLELENEAAKEYYNTWVSTFEAIVKARKIIFEEGNLGLELDEKTIAQLAADAILGGQGATFDPVTWLNDLFNQKKNNVTNYTLPAYQSGAIGTNAQFLAYDSAGFLTSTQKQSGTAGDSFEEKYKEYFISKWIDHMSEEALAPYSLLLNAPKETVLTEENAKKYGITAATYDSMMNDANLFKTLGILGQDQATKLYGFHKNAAEATELLKAWQSVTGVDDLTNALSAIFATTLGEQMAKEATYRKNLYTDAETNYNSQITSATEDQKIVQKAMKEGMESLSRTEKAELNRIMNEGGYSTLEEANIGLASSADAAAAGLDRLIAALSQGYITDGNGNWFRSEKIRGTKIANSENSFDSIEAAQEWAAKQDIDLTGWSRTSSGGISTTTIQQDSTTGKYFLRSDVVSVDDIITENSPTWQNFAPQKTEHLDNAYLAAAQVAGFNTLAEQQAYIDAMVAAGKDSTNYSDGGMATLAELKSQGLSDEEALAKQREYANQLALMEQGLSELNASGEEWLKTLKDENKTMLEKSKILPNLKKSYQKLLGLSDDFINDKEKEGFFLDPKNLELAQKAAEEAGEEGQKALDELQARAVTFGKEADELNTKIGNTNKTVSELATELSQLTELDAGDVLSGQSADWADAYWDHVVQTAIAGGASLSEAIAQANSDLGTLGIDVEPGFDAVTENISAPTWEEAVAKTGTTEMTITDPVTGAQHTVTADNYQTLLETHGGSIPVTYFKGKNGQGITKENVGGSENTYRKGAEKTGGGRRSGGGGGSRRRYLAKAKPEDHKERYHEINAAIDDVSDALERLNKQQDRAWGSARIKAMQEESKLLREQTDLYRKKAKEAEGYLNGYYDSNNQWVKGDRQRAEEAGWIIDENGRVSNYEERLDDIINDYNAKIMEYNAMSAGEQEALEKLVTEANERFEKGDASAEQYLNPETGVAFSSYEEYLKYTFFDAPQKYLEQYEATMEEWEEQQKLILDNLYAEYDGYVEQIKLTAENMLAYIDDQIAYIEHKLSRLEDNAYKTAESIDLIVSKITASEAKLSVAEGELATLLGAHDINVEDFLAGAVSAEDLKNANFTETEINMLRDIMSNAQNAEKEMSEGMVKGIESMTSSFEEFNKDLDRYTTSIEHAQSITSTYRNIIDLTGKSLSGFSVELLKAFNESTIEQAKANMTANKTKYETVQVQYQESLSAWELAQAQYAAGTIEDAAYLAAKSHFEATEDSLREAQEAYVASWEAAIQAVSDAYKNTMESVIEDISKKLANGLTGGLDALQEYMDRAKTADFNYVDDYEKIYQLTKLTRDLESKIDNTQNVKTQKELLKFQKEINDILQSDKQLSEYDIDYLQKKYDLKLAEIALEDAQNAKSQVTMRRDSEGNYNYVYTADENAVAEAEAEYEGKLYEMQKANDEYITSLSDSILSLEQDMLSAIGALDPAQFASQEDYNNRVAEIIDFYTKQMEYQSSEMGKVLANNKSLYDNDMKWYAEYRDYKMADAKTFLDSWDKILLAQVSGFSTQEAFFDNFRTQAGSLAQESLNEYAKWADQIKTINTTAGTSTETLGTDLGKQVEDLTGKAQAAATAMEAHAGKIKTAVEGITSSVSDMLKTFEGKVGDAAKRVDSLTGSILALFKILGVEGFDGLDLDGVLAGLNIEIDNAKNDTPFDNETPGEKLDTGGYTGSWGPEGRLAWLHQKELVLNAHDTANMLASVGILRQIANVIDLNALSSAGGFASLMQTGVHSNKETLQQEVHIEAHFPNATDKNQIEEAFKDIVNLAAQYANSF